MQNYRVFRVATDKASERMWKEYAQEHQGIALRITPNVEKDSRYLKFAPVTYQEKRPPVFARTADFAAESLFGNLRALWRMSLSQSSMEIVIKKCRERFSAHKRGQISQTLARRR